MSFYWKFLYNMSQITNTDGGVHRINRSGIVYAKNHRFLVYDTPLEALSHYVAGNVWGDNNDICGTLENIIGRFYYKDGILKPDCIFECSDELREFIHIISDSMCTYLGDRGYELARHVKEVSDMVIGVEIKNNENNINEIYAARDEEDDLEFRGKVRDFIDPRLKLRAYDTNTVIRNSAIFQHIILSQLLSGKISRIKT